jgi:hypothetical protein
MLEAIKLAIYGLAELYECIYTEGFSDHHLDDGVDLRNDHHLLLLVVQVHYHFVSEVKFLAFLTVDILLLDEVVEEEHERTVASHLVLENGEGLQVDREGNLAQLKVVD